MKAKALVVLLTVALANICWAQIDIDKLTQSIDILKDYQYDQTQGVDLVWVEKQVGMASADRSVRSKVEQALIGSLKNAQTNDARQFLCRQLRTIGTAQSVPILATLLTDPDMSHMARYALGRINAPEAGKALHEALGKTSGKIKAGLINTLGMMHYNQALTDFLQLAERGDTELRMAAIRALGYYASPKVVSKLKRIRLSSSKSVRVEVDAALLRVADGCVDAENDELAIAIYTDFYRGKHPEHLRTAGLKGLARASGLYATVDLLVEAIKGEDAHVRSSAIVMLAQIRGKTITDTFVDLLKAIPADGQELIIRSLATRADISATPTIIAMTRSEHEPVRNAALEALGDIGTPQAIGCLALNAASAQAARTSLVRIRGKGIDTAIINAITTGSTKSRIEVIRAIGQRLDHGPFDVLHQVAQTDIESSVRREAILSMGRIGQTADLNILIQLTVKPNSPRDRDSLERAIVMVFNKMDNKADQADPVLSALETAPNEAKGALLRLLVKPATDTALVAVRKAVTSPHSQVSDTAIRSLGQWPNPAPIDQLYTIASTSTNPIHRILALRGYVRLTPLTQDPTTGYTKALKLTRRPDEIKLVLGGLHHAGTLKALEIAESYMANPDLKADAYLAATKVANVYCWQDRNRAQTTLNKVIGDAPNSNTRNQARDVIRRMDRFKSVMAVWKGVGPFTVPGLHSGPGVFNTIFAPEENIDAENIAWRIIQPDIDGNGRIDLEKTFGRIDYCAAYLRTTIHSPKDQQARLKWGVDDHVKGWLNGKPTNDGLIQLKKGANTFVLKVGDHGGGWNFGCELLKPDESHLPGLTFER
jgi:HEAT repeat protein